jgi:uncharacterized protein
MAKEDPEEVQKIADQIIRNTYRTLMTRGQMSCFIFCTDPKLNDYFKERLRKTSSYNDLSPKWCVKVAEERVDY